MFNVLDLCSGTCSIRKFFNENGGNVAVDELDVTTGLAFDGRNPTFISDITKFDKTSLKIGYYDWIHFSPPCTEYSTAKTIGIRKLDLADAIVLAGLDIIEYLQQTTHVPRITVENPFGGLLKTREKCVDRLTKLNCKITRVDYCVFGTPYRKATAIWNNFDLPIAKCPGIGHCPSMRGRRHVAYAQRGDGYSQQELYSIPQTLLAYVIRNMYN